MMATFLLNRPIKVTFKFFGTEYLETIDRIVAEPLIGSVDAVEEDARSSLRRTARNFDGSEITDQEIAELDISNGVRRAYREARNCARISAGLPELGDEL